MKRREFITLLGGVAAWPLRVHAQEPGGHFIVLAQAMIPRTGMMDAQNPMPMKERYAQLEANRKARLERATEIERQTREAELRNLQLKVQQQSWWQQSVENAARKAEAQQRLQARLAFIDSWSEKLPAESEPTTVVYNESEEDTGKLTYPTLNRWFVK